MGALFLTTPPAHFSPLPNPNRGRRKEVKSPRFRTVLVARCAADLSLGPGEFHYDKNLKFPRMRVWNPYKRLGIPFDASEEEIRGARNFLLDQYAGHESSVESIEGAYEKILMASFRQRKKEKINLKSRLKKKVEESPSWVKRLLEYVEAPPVDTVLRRLFLFVFLGGWSITTSAEAGPTFQVALSIGSCIYFLNDKMNDIKRASITGFGALVLGWFFGSIFVPTIPAVLFTRTWTLELYISLFCYVFLFLSCTFLK